MARLTAFLDANIMFSAALGGSSFKLLWELADAGHIELCSCQFCFTEAEENLRRKRPDRLEAYGTLRAGVAEVPDAPEGHTDADELVDEKDVPVLAAALAAGADVLLTGDKKHFGALMGRTDLPLRVRTVRAFLLEGP